MITLGLEKGILSFKRGEPDTRLTKMHAKALTCFNFFNFHPVSTKFRIGMEHVIPRNRMFLFFELLHFWRENELAIVNFMYLFGSRH